MLLRFYCSSITIFRRRLFPYISFSLLFLVLHPVLHYPVFYLLSYVHSSQTLNFSFYDVVQHTFSTKRNMPKQLSFLLIIVFFLSGFFAAPPRLSIHLIFCIIFQHHISKPSTPQDPRLRFVQIDTPDMVF